MVEPIGNAFVPTEVTREQRLAWVTQGLVLYVRGSLATVWPQVLSVFDAVMSIDNNAAFSVFQCSHETGWRLFDQHSKSALRRHLELMGGKRPFWHLEVANKDQFPDLSFELADIHTTLGHERASFIRLRLPFNSDPSILSNLTRRLATILPFWFGTAGYQFSFLEASREAAFDQIWAWARRYWGVEVVHTRTGSWDVLTGVPRLNWITLLGEAFVAERLPSLELTAQRNCGLEVWRCNHGCALQGGAAPIIGDINIFQDISAYVSLSTVLASGYVKEPLPFPGMFTDQASTGAWIRRFAEPEKWLNPEGI